uniref:PD-(D/E)XK nuclease superfamily protein n=1 Tax=Siphoviridae sp. ct1yA16 TaxID=2827767 RepID=A0A8S5TEQ2_9CAUD|nr:MAG TPA: PD-(D/E)XK nuclease superfamily protein [Siphoviridae sp. ct1yA16]
MHSFSSSLSITLFFVLFRYIISLSFYERWCFYV